MKLLFVNSCIREHSRTRELCEYYIRSKYKSDDEIKTMVLSEMNLLPLYAEALRKREKDISEHDYSSEEYINAKLFAEADEIIIGAPYWDCSFPSLLKLYFEHICVNGITFGYGSNGIPISFCHAAKMIYITTSGGYIPQSNSLECYLKEICTMFGIPELRFYTAQGLDIHGNDAASIMTQATDMLSADKR